MSSDTRNEPEVLEAGEALLDARSRDDLARIAEIVDRWGVDLAHSAFASALYDVAAELPLDLADARPGLAFRFEDIGRLPVGTTPVGLPRTYAEARAETAAHGDLRLRQALLPLITRRRLGRFAEAMAIVQAATPLADATVYPLYGDRSQILPYWYLQSGITAQVSGDLDTGRRYFLSAWSHRSRDPYGFVARATAGRLAQHDAFTGNRTSSDDWLTRARAADRRADLWVDGFVEANLTLTDAIHAVDALDPDAERFLQTTTHPSQRSEQWAFFLWIFVQHALSLGDTAAANRLLTDAIASRPPELVGAGLSAALVPLVRSQIQLASGQGHRALTEIDASPEVAGLVGTQRARTLLLANRPDAALVEVHAVTAAPTTCRRARSEALLIEAVARLAQDDRVGAVAAARRATALVREQRAPRLLATVARAALDDLAPDVPDLAPLLTVLDERGHSEIFPADVQLVSVTERELELLRDLSTDRTLPEIAALKFVSVNTVRTHLANLRRKLGAKSRDEVLARAHQLGLLESTARPSRE